ncbi:proline-rich protein 2-like [Dipodomys merriami]|uniref:proline-rich protein 2-like n=1 Tax=Dipodomys merriami TaxID=94247 RepID=UPI003855F5FA
MAGRTPAPTTPGPSRATGPPPGPRAASHGPPPTGRLPRPASRPTGPPPTARLPRPASRPTGRLPRARLPAHGPPPTGRLPAHGPPPTGPPPGPRARLPAHGPPPTGPPPGPWARLPRPASHGPASHGPPPTGPPPGPWARLPRPASRPEHTAHGVPWAGRQQRLWAVPKSTSTARPPPVAPTQDGRSERRREGGVRAARAQRRPSRMVFCRSPIPGPCPRQPTLLPSRMQVEHGTCLASGRRAQRLWGPPGDRKAPVTHSRCGRAVRVTGQL